MTLKTAQRHLKELLQKYNLPYSELMKALNILESLDQRNREQEAGVVSQTESESDEYDGRDYDNEAKQYQDDLRESDAPTPYDP